MAERPDGPRVAAVADTDSRLKWSWATAQLLAGARAPDIIVAESPVAPSNEQIDDVTDGRATMARSVSIGSFVDDPVIAAADVLTVCLPTRALVEVHRQVAALHRRTGRRPVVVVGYAGLVYENRVEGLAWRIGADVICVNSRADEHVARSLVDELNRPSQRIVRLGYPQFARSTRPSDAPAALTFAAQPDVPARRVERLHLLERLIGYARRHPHETVILKLRTRPGERTTHPQPHDYRRLARQFEPLPSNLTFETGAISDTLDRTRCLVTVSSTAALESMARGLPTVLLTDFGVSERLGNHVFVGSGCMRSLGDVEGGAMPNPVAAWADEHGVFDDGSDALRATVSSLLHGARGTSDALGPLLPSIERTATTASGRGWLRTAAHGPARDLVSRLQRWASD